MKKKIRQEREAGSDYEANQGGLYILKALETFKHGSDMTTINE